MYQSQKRAERLVCLGHGSARLERSSVFVRADTNRFVNTFRSLGSLALPNGGRCHDATSHLSLIPSYVSQDEQALVLKPADIGLSASPVILVN
jgi:hypothetical protein